MYYKYYHSCKEKNLKVGEKITFWLTFEPNMTYDYIARYVIERERKKILLIVPWRNWKNRRILTTWISNGGSSEFPLGTKSIPRQQLRFINVTIVTSDSLNSKHNYIVTAWFNDDRRSKSRHADLFTLNNTQGTVVL